jgi:hypothetical protein
VSARIEHLFQQLQTPGERMERRGLTAFAYLVHDIKIVRKRGGRYEAEILVQDVDERLQEREPEQRIHLGSGKRAVAARWQTRGLHTVAADGTQDPHVPAGYVAACAGLVRIIRSNV